MRRRRHALDHLINSAVALCLRSIATTVGTARRDRFVLGSLMTSFLPIRPMV